MPFNSILISKVYIRYEFFQEFLFHRVYCWEQTTRFPCCSCPEVLVTRDYTIIVRVLELRCSNLWLYKNIFFLKIVSQLGASIWIEEIKYLSSLEGTFKRIVRIYLQMFDILRMEVNNQMSLSSNQCMFIPPLMTPSNQPEPFPPVWCWRLRYTTD